MQPDGTRILFSQNSANVILDLSKDWKDQTLHSLPTPENNERFVAWDWSPDGKKLIGTLSTSRVTYYSFETNRYEKVVNVGSYPKWFPDSSRFIFVVDGNAHVGDIATKRVRELLAIPEMQMRSIAISRDGQLIYLTPQSDESDIWLLDLP